MAIFQHILWGYEVAYPDSWVHQPIQDADGFAAISEAIDMNYAGPNAGQVVIRGEWNSTRQEVEPIWNRHIGMLASMLNAKQVGAAPWQMGGATGIEAEIVLPKKENRRLWAGMLAIDFRILHFMVTHPIDQRPTFEPLATGILKSLRFPPRILGLRQTSEGLPLPPNYTAIDPKNVINDIADPKQWRAYDGEDGVGSLQAFYLREAPVHDWDVVEYVPFPSQGDPGFARIRLRRGDQQVTVGILPFDEEKVTSSSPAKLVFKIA